ncbi:hypothetical protein EVAR_11714_1 [Eumeta japonica]|uniref:Uncharacterized protein n=1 Tax=Eumeta variegata TaxID=151549 RepID=A0A4C1U4Y1_EUMVA|nr:hypothetical protein EVAR_11714_1 [Eumeta japonica]
MAFINRILVVGFRANRCRAPSPRARLKFHEATATAWSRTRARLRDGISLRHSSDSSERHNPTAAKRELLRKLVLRFPMLLRQWKVTEGNNDKVSPRPLTASEELNQREPLASTRSENAGVRRRRWRRRRYGVDGVSRA